jgi:ribosomal protein S18 acetylase RimI-like enzyme
MTGFLVRPYRRPDRAALFRIAADTAFFGDPVEVFLDDRRIFCDAFYAYYTDLEPDYSWVACVEEEVVGFVVGATDTTRQERRWRRELLIGVLWRALRVRYRVGRRTLTYTDRIIRSSLRGEFPHADLFRYPAHLHINVDAPWRGQGIGRSLIVTYLDQLRGLGVPGVHLHTTSLNEAACRLYTGVGFRLLDARPTTVWSHLVDRPVENRCYGLRLVEDSVG